MRGLTVIGRLDPASMDRYRSKHYPPIPDPLPPPPPLPPHMVGPCEPGIIESQRVTRALRLTELLIREGLAEGPAKPGRPCEALALALHLAYCREPRA